MDGKVLNIRATKWIDVHETSSCSPFISKQMRCRWARDEYSILWETRNGWSKMALISINQSNTRRNGHANASSNLAHFNNYRHKKHVSTEKLTEHDHQITALQLTKWQSCIKNLKWMRCSRVSVYILVMITKSRDSKKKKKSNKNVKSWHYFRSKWFYVV